MNKAYAFSTSVSGEVDTWFTAWVMKVFHKASKLIYIDPRIIVGARKWLECHLQKDGCFKVFGKNFAKRFPDAGSKEVIVCAHVTIALLEMNIPVHNPLVQKSLTNLKQNIDEHSSVYAKALLVYCLTLAKDWGASSKLMHHLDSIAIKEGEFLYWSPTPNDKVSSLSVEITSYILLAKLSSSHSGEELSCSFSIVKWLFHVQFHHCGSHYFKAFSLAFKAITLYSSFGSKHYGSTSVTVTSSADHLSFHVNEENKLIYQKMELQNPRGHYQLKAEGSSCTAVQITSVYGVAPSTTVCSFSVEVEVVVQKCCEERLITLKLKSSYKGSRSSTGVVVVKLEVPSGFSPDPNSLKKLKKADHVNDVDYKSGHVIVYLQELSNDHPLHHQLDLIQEHEVHDLRHSTVIIYELDCPSVRGGTKYCGKTCTEYIDSHTHEYHHHLPDQESHHDHDHYHDNKIYKDSALHCGRWSIRPACRRQRLKVKRPRFKFGQRHSLYE
ncbi:alpha-2-macroglobulin-like protein 1 [Cyprinodon tularosa]|uniref:alpha-2-macroglobulin-like protein 1 n=1 Tax=Cyprinodon tularosa TaxID=77115 RepID=UPI0018E25EE6|nr:alpha-2-macroglobulin-like protein 1 [Cyprinodon tularosa]